MPVRLAVCVAVKMEMWSGRLGDSGGVRVRMQVPASPGVAKDHRATERDQQQRHQEIGHGPEPVGQPEPEQHDGPHHHADARRVSEGPGEAQATGVEQAPLSRGQGRDRGQVVRLERVAEAEQEAETREGEEAGMHDGRNLAGRCLGRSLASPRPAATFHG